MIESKVKVWVCRCGHREPIHTQEPVSAGAQPWCSMAHCACREYVRGETKVESTGEVIRFGPLVVPEGHPYTRPEIIPQGPRNGR